MSGSYTIGLSAASSYHTFTDAVSDLNIYGVSGPVIFLIEDGIYTEQLLIPHINGTTAGSTITFRSLNHDSSKVILRYTPVSANANYTLCLFGADYFRFEKMSIESTGSFLACAILLQNGARHNEFSNNVIKSTPITTGTPFNGAELVRLEINSGITENSGNLFIQNHFQYGSAGIHISSYSTSIKDSNTLIKGNYFEDQAFYGIYSESSHDIDIGQNRISSSWGEQYSAIFLKYISHYKITGNYISHGHATNMNGIYAAGISCTERNLIANNMISIASVYDGKSFSLIRGICLLSDSSDLFYNSVFIYKKSLPGESYGLYLDSCTGIQAANNLFINASDGLAIKSTASLYYGNHNDFFSSDRILGMKDSLIATSLDSLKNILASDQNSICYHPDFVSQTDLHTYDILLDKQGMAITNVTEDIDHELRDTVSPDMGADEFSPFSHDLCIMGFIYPVSEMYCNLSDSEAVVAIIKNKGMSEKSGFSLNIKVISDSSYSLKEFVADTIQSLDTLFYIFRTNVSFENPGIYKLIVSVTDSSDQNPSNNSDSVSFSVYRSIQNFPFMEDFETGLSYYFKPLAAEYSKVSIDSKGAKNSNFGIHFQGGEPGKPWAGSYNGTTDSNAWLQNTSHHSSISGCMVDAGSLNHLRLSMDLKQSYSYGNKYSWFRVLINDSIQIENLNGLKNFNPKTNQDSFETQCFDLDKFAGTKFKLTLQAACFLKDLYYNKGDNVYLDNIRLFVPAANDLSVAEIYEPPDNSCRDSAVRIGIKIRNFGYDTSLSFHLKTIVYTPYDTLISDSIFNDSIPPNQSKVFHAATINTIPYGSYRIFADCKIYGDSVNICNDTLSKTIVYEPLRQIPYSERFDSSKALGNWNTQNMWLAYPGHHGTPSFLMANSVWSVDSIARAETAQNISGITDYSWLSFNYRIVSSYYPHYAVQMNPNDFIAVIVHDGCSQTQDTIIFINALNYKPDVAMHRMMAPLKTYKGSDVKIKIVLKSDSFNFYYFDFDNIEIASLPDGLGNKTYSICEDDSIIFSEMPDTLFSYLWYEKGKKDTLSVTNTFKPYKEGVYIARIVNEIGWEVEDTFFLTIKRKAHILTTKDTGACLGDSILLWASGGERYLWNNGDTNCCFYMPVLKNEMFRVEITDSNKCVSSDSINIRVLPLPEIKTMSDTSVCQGDSIIIWAAASGTLLWNNGDTNSFFKIPLLSDQRFSVNVKGENACLNADSFMVFVKALPQLDLGHDTVVCGGKAVLINAGNDYDSIIWFTASKDSFFMADSNGTGFDTLFVWATVFRSGCINSDSVMIIFINCGGMSENIPGNDFMLVYPNPAKDHFTLFIKFPQNNARQLFHIFLTDMNGKTVFSKTVSDFSSNPCFEFPLPSLNKGLYFLNVRSETFSETKKIMIK